MSETRATAPRRGQRLVSRNGRRIGAIDAVFADYLLVRTSGLLPVDLYVPRNEVSSDDSERMIVEKSPHDAYHAWHRPLKRAPHD